jgi:hypothetical protein
MARYNPRLRINQDWAVKAELCNAGGYLGNLRIGMRARIPGIWDESNDGPLLYAFGRNWREG